MVAASNGTLHCKIICPFLTQKVIDIDANVYFCSYHEWAYAIAALFCTIASIVPLGLILSCLAKERKRRLKISNAHIHSCQTSTDGTSRFGLSTESEFENVCSPIPYKPGGYYKGTHYGAYGTFSSLPDDVEQIGANLRKPHGDILHGIGSQGCVGPHGSTTETLSGLPFDFTHFGNKVPGNKKKTEKVKCTGNPTCSATSNDHHGDYVTESNRHMDGAGSLERSCQDRQLLPDTHNINSEDYISFEAEGSNYENNHSNSSSCAVPSARNGRANSKDNTHENCESDLGTSPYLYSLPTRKDFEEYLLGVVAQKPEGERNGTFLIRDSMSGYDSKVLMMFCKSVEVPRNLFYFKICFTASGRVYVEGPTNDTFESIDDLILYHRRYKSFFPCFLGESLGTKFTSTPRINSISSGNDQ